jgi:hypothetical protein
MLRLAAPAPASDPAGPRSNVADAADGRDSLNLAEFPLTLLSDRPPAGCEELRYTDTVYDSGAGGKPVTRTLRVVPAAGVGLPTAADGDVLLALIQLTHRANRFSDRTVTFTRHGVIQLLGWDPGGRHYVRVEQALNRWVGVTLYFDRAWWDRRRRCWVDERLHVLDRVSLRASDGAPSELTWGEVVFASFAADGLKRLDLATYTGLKTPAARRLYRFLDKRLYRQPVAAFDLRHLCEEKVGFSRGYDAANLKRLVARAAAELVACGFLEPAAPDERFLPAGRPGEWRVCFARARTAADAPAGGETPSLAGELAARGVSPPVAAALCAQFPPAHVQARLDVFDWLREARDPRVEKNSPGYLVDSVRRGYAPPADFPAPPARTSTPSPSG